jgi:uncharacterized glyoxalase superfamily protein PhnB
MKNVKANSQAVTFENEPADTLWGERFFHVREPDGYQLSFVHLLSKKKQRKNKILLQINIREGE